MSDALANTSTDWDSIVAANIRAEMARERWTGRKAAMALGVTQTYVSRRLAGITTLSPGDLQLFASLLKMPVSKFFEIPGDSADPIVVHPPGLEPGTH